MKCKIGSPCWKKKNKKYITWGLFWIFSLVLFINNTTQLLSNWFTLTYKQINIIAWIGIFGSLLYVLWRKSEGKK